MIRNVHAVKVDAELQQLRVRLYIHKVPQLGLARLPFFVTAGIDVVLCLHDVLKPPCLPLLPPPKPP